MTDEKSDISISFRVPVSTREKLRYLSKKQRRTMSNYIVNLIDEKMEEAAGEKIQ